MKNVLLIFFFFILSYLVKFVFSPHFSFILSSRSPYPLICPPLSSPYAFSLPSFSPFFLLYISASSLIFPPILSLAHTTSPLHFLFLLLQRLVVLLNNWFWLSQCADKDNSRAIKSSSPVLSSCFFSLPAFILQTQTFSLHLLCLSPFCFLTPFSSPWLSSFSPPSPLLVSKRAKLTSPSDFPFLLYLSCPVFLPSLLIIPPLSGCSLCCLHSCFQSHLCDTSLDVHCDALQAGETVKSAET